MNTISTSLLFRWFLCLSIYTILINHSCAQTVKLVLWQDSLSTSVGSTFTNRLLVINTGNQKQEISIALQVPRSIQVVSTFPDQLDLLPNDTLIVPIKGLINHQSSLPVEQVSVQLTDKVGRILESKSFSLFMKGKERTALTLHASDEPIVLFTTVESARLPLRLVHNHATRKKFFIDILSIPVGMNQAAFPMPIELKPNQDTTLSVIINPLRHWSTSHPYQIAVTIRDEQKSVVGTAMYKLVVAASTKEHVNSGIDPRGGYGASVALSSLNNDQWGKEIRVWGTDSVGKAQLNFNLSYINVGSNHFQQLQNSFVSLHTNQFMVRAGSIYDFHELPLFGRGLKVMLNQANRQWTLWAINSTQNWLSAETNPWSGNTVSVRYDSPMRKLKGGSYSVSSSYYSLANSMRSGYLNYASFQYEKSERHSLQLLVGQSIEFATNSARRALTFGWAGQLNYRYQSEKINWQFRSYFSNPFYAGIQKGATQLFSQFYWQTSARSTLTARINHLRYNRALFTSPTDYYKHVISNTVVELSANYQLGKTTFTIRPYLFAQSDHLNPYSQRADANRLSTAISYRRSSGQFFSVNYDIGTFYNRTAPAPHNSYLSQRLTASFTMGPFNLWTYWQKGPYYLFDIREGNPANFKVLTVTPAVRFSLFDRKLSGHIGLTYLRDESSAKSRYIATGRVQYDVNPNLSINLLGNGTPYLQENQTGYSLYQLQVTKLFQTIKNKQRNQLQLSFFEDINGNGEKDSGEQWMDGLLVSINDNTLLTDSKGTIMYKNVPPAQYTVSVLSTGRPGDPVLYHEVIDLMAGQIIKKAVPLARTFKVAGQLSCPTSSYDRQPCKFDRFVVDVEQNSKKIVSIIPLPDGSFVTHLAPGDYTILVRDTGQSPQPTVKTVPITLTETGQYPPLNWVIDGAGRPIEIKRFTKK